MVFSADFLVVRMQVTRWYGIELGLLFGRPDVGMAAVRSSSPASLFLAERRTRQTTQARVWRWRRSVACMSPAGALSINAGLDAASRGLSLGSVCHGVRVVMASHGRRKGMTGCCWMAALLRISTTKMAYVWCVLLMGWFGALLQEWQPRQQCRQFACSMFVCLEAGRESGPDRRSCQFRDPSRAIPGPCSFASRFEMAAPPIRRRRRTDEISCRYRRDS